MNVVIHAPFYLFHYQSLPQIHLGPRSFLFMLYHGPTQWHHSSDWLPAQFITMPLGTHISPHYLYLAELALLHMVNWTQTSSIRHVRLSIHSSLQHWLYTYHQCQPFLFHQPTIHTRNPFSTSFKGHISDHGIILCLPSLETVFAVSFDLSPWFCGNGPLGKRFLIIYFLHISHNSMH
jgi:hypothetical protein